MSADAPNSSFPTCLGRIGKYCFANIQVAKKISTNPLRILTFAMLHGHLDLSDLYGVGSVKNVRANLSPGMKELVAFFLAKD